MSPGRNTHRADLNQHAIVTALRQLGMSVQILSQTGSGCPDVLVGHAHENILLEIKQPKGVLSAIQILWHKAWRGQVAVVRTVDEAIAAINKRVRGR